MLQTVTYMKILRKIVIPVGRILIKNEKKEDFPDAKLLISVKKKIPCSIL